MAPLRRGATEIHAAGDIPGGLPADLPHLAWQSIAVELAEIQAASRTLGRDGGPQYAADVLVRTAVAQQGGDVRLGAREQAVADLAVGGQPDPIAIAAEWFGGRIDEAHIADAIRQPVD